jgi:DNA-binding beta-propeller fold protein YncE
MVAILIPILLGGMLAVYFLNTSVRFTRDVLSSQTVLTQPAILVEEMVEDTPTPNLYPQPVLEFGSEGSAPGQFEDAREITVDLAGNIYVADYNTGRVQKFDHQGNFLYQILVEAGSNGTWLISDLAIGPDNRLFVARVGDLLVYNGEDGSLLADDYARDLMAFFRSVSIDPLNHIYAVQSTALQNSLFIFDQEGNLIQSKDDFISQVNPGDPALNLMIAVDGLGRSYVLSNFGRQVYLFDRSGNFVDRFVSRKNDDFWNAEGIAVDGKGRIYLPNISDIQIFDANGFPSDTLEMKPEIGALRDLAIDSQGYLYLVSGNGKVLKFAPVEP